MLYLFDLYGNDYEVDIPMDSFQYYLCDENRLDNESPHGQVVKTLVSKIRYTSSNLVGVTPALIQRRK